MKIVFGQVVATPSSKWKWTLSCTLVLSSLIDANRKFEQMII